MTDYEALCREADALFSGVPHPLANLANGAALLGERLDDVNWAGFYLAERELLTLGPFWGRPACTEIPFSRGVCGAAARSGEAVLVKDVHQFPGHIACDSRSRSEVVIPLWKNGALYGVLDVDSPTLARFDEEDLRGLSAFCRILEAAL